MTNSEAFHTNPMTATMMNVSRYPSASNQGVMLSPTHVHASAQNFSQSGTTSIFVRQTEDDSITPWLDALGYRDTFIMVAVIGFVWNASLFVMVRIGPKLRAASAERYWADVARARAKGLGH
jgi:hypothetical protein